jgi:hypothetical protein
MELAMRMGKRVLGFVLASYAFSGISGFADGSGNESEQARVVRFLREHVIGKTVGVKETAKIANGKVETEFSSRRTFANLVETRDGFIFDVIWNIEQMNYDLDDDGRRIQPGHKKDRIGVGRYEAKHTQSAKRLIGFHRIVVNSYTDPTGFAEAIRVKLEGNSLIIDSSTINYTDFYAAGGRYRPCASESREEISLRDGKIEFKYTSEPYHVDPETLKRTRTGEPPEVTVYKQVD